MAVGKNVNDKRGKSIEINIAEQWNSVTNSYGVKGEVFTLEALYCNIHNNNVCNKNTSEQFTIESHKAGDNIQCINHRKDDKFQDRKAEPEYRHKFISWRCAIVLLLHAFLLVNVMPKQNLPMALVCMVAPQRSMNSNITNQTMFADANDSSSHTKTRSFEFDWDAKTIGLLLTGNQFVSFLGPLAANFLKEIIGGKRSLVTFTIIITTLSFVSPNAARKSPYILLAIRIITGICSGTAAPIVSEALAWWSPESEKLTWVSLAFAGLNVAGITSSLISGFMCSVPLDNGWPLIFYFTGGINFLWLVAYYLLYTDKPEKHLYLSEKEKVYIITHREGMNFSKKKKIKVPYKNILTSVPVLAYIYASTCHIWANTVTATYLPMYISGVLKFSVEETGVVLSVIALARFLGSFFWTGVGNWLMSKSFMSKSKLRKLYIFTGLATAGLINIAQSYLDVQYRIVAITVLLLMMFLQSAGLTTLTVIPLDLAPMFSGFITSLDVTIGKLVSISGPLVVAALAPNSTFEEWRIIWIITSFIYLSAGLVFGIFGQSVLQPWAEEKKEMEFNTFIPFTILGKKFFDTYTTPPPSPLSPSTMPLSSTFHSNTAHSPNHISPADTTPPPHIRPNTTPLPIPFHLDTTPLPIPFHLDTTPPPNPLIPDTTPPPSPLSPDTTPPLSPLSPVYNCDVSLQSRKHTSNWQSTDIHGGKQMTEQLTPGSNATSSCNKLVFQDLDVQTLWADHLSGGEDILEFQSELFHKETNAAGEKPLDETFGNLDSTLECLERSCTKLTNEIPVISNSFHSSI